jgi:type I restriction enzyme S subunit
MTLSRYRIKNVATINDEVLYDSTPPDTEIRYVEIGDVRFNEGITSKTDYVYENAPSRARRKVKDGDVIISTVRTYLKAVAPIKNPESNLIVSTGFAVVRPKKSLLSPTFAGYLLLSENLLNEVVSKSVGVSYPAVNPEDIGNIEILLPPLPIQKAIAAYLDKETARIDALIAKKERQIELLQEKRQAIITRAITKGLDPNAKMKDSGVEWIGEIPEGWEIVKLKWLYKGIGSGNGISPDDIEESGTYPVYGGNGIMGFTENFNSDGDDIIIGRVGAKCGNVYLSSGKKWISDNALNLQINKLEKEFVAQLLEIRNLNDLANKNAQPLITGSMVGNQEVIVPPIVEQKRIIDYLRREKKAIADLQMKVDASLNFLREYRSSLITAAVSGQIYVSQEVAQ